ncbi:hypothetical protein BGY98DRAFT_932403 [Russula aff. rugulosa BPL654]|nr:hypothetical protein BGY98DRAFT_932403 [Russula aff. rugulosa BPL654]
MKISIFSAVSAALFVAGVSAQMTVNTPSNVLECSPLLITFTGGQQPYIITILPGATPDGTALTTFSGVTGSPFNWTAVNFPSGTSLGITLHDSSGLLAQTAAFTVEPGASTSCLNGTASGVNAGTNAPAASTPTSAAATTTGTSPANTASKAGTASTGSSTSKAASPSGNAAIIAGIPYGVAGVLGAAIAAVFV